MTDFKKKLMKIFILFSIVLILAGLKYGDIESLIIKSRNICYECIGVG